MVCDMIFIYPLLDFSIHVIGSTPLLLLHYLTEKKKKVIAPIEVRTIGAWGLQHPPPLPPPFQILGSSDFWGNKRNLGKPNFYKSFHVSFLLFFSLKEFFDFELKSAW